MGAGGGPWPPTLPPPPGARTAPTEDLGPRAARLAPVAFVIGVVHPVAAEWFTLWAVDGVLHCDRADVECRLGFAIHLLLPAAVGAVVALYVIVAGIVLRPGSRPRAWLWLLTPTALTWLTVWWMLAITVDSHP